MSKLSANFATLNVALSHLKNKSCPLKSKENNFSLLTQVHLRLFPSHLYKPRGKQLITILISSTVRKKLGKKNYSQTSLPYIYENCAVKMIFMK